MTMLANGGRPAARLITGAHQRTAGLYLALREAAASDTDLARRLREVEERRLVSAEQGLSSTGYSTSHPKRRRKAVAALLVGAALWASRRPSAPWRREPTPWCAWSMGQR